MTILITALILGGVAWLVWAPPNGHNIHSVKTSDKAVALTFDDGPNPPHTNAILEVLAAHDAKATFFMIGDHIESHPDCARRVPDAGHQVANHSYDHSVLAFRGRGFIRDQVERTDRIIRGLGYDDEILFRAPRAMQFLTVASYLKKTGRPHIGASIISKDWYDSSADRIASRVLRSVKPGAIISLHDGAGSENSGDRSPTVSALATILEQLGADGYRCVTLLDLLAKEGKDS